MHGKTIGIGLIGCGIRLRGVVGRLMEHHDNRLRLVGAYDPSMAMIDAARAQLAPDLRAYDAYEALVQDPAIDWVMIGSWNCFHAEQAIAAFNAGKHVFCEKPLATTLEDCLAMREAWRHSGKQFAIGFILRYSAHYWKLKELVAGGAIGRLVSMEFNETLDFNHGGYIHGDWRRFVRNAGTHLLEKCSHDIDLANWIVESRAARVASFGGLNFFTPENAHHIDRLGKDPETGRDAFNTWDRPVYQNAFTAEKDIIDNQVAILEYENGVRASFHTNCCSAIPERRMVLLGTEGTIRADVISGAFELRRIGFNTRTEVIETGASGGHGGGDPIQGELLARCILKGDPPKAGFDDGFTAAITCFGIDEAMNTGRVVNMDDYWRRVGGGLRHGGSDGVAGV